MNRLWPDQKSTPQINYKILAVPYKIAYTLVGEKHECNEMVIRQYILYNQLRKDLDIDRVNAISTVYHRIS